MYVFGYYAFDPIEASAENRQFKDIFEHLQSMAEVRAEEGRRGSRC